MFIVLNFFGEKNQMKKFFSVHVKQHQQQQQTKNEDIHI